MYVDFNPTTKRIFYVGVGSDVRVSCTYRNDTHQQIVDQLMTQEIRFQRKVIYRQIPLEKAYKIEIQIIAKCGRLYNGTGYLANIHHGGKIVDNDYRSGKTFADIFGETRSIHIRSKQSKAIRESVLHKMGRQRVSARRRRGEYTERELSSYKRTSEFQRGKTMQERLNNPNYVDLRKGRAAKEIYNDPNYQPHNKGKTAKELYGDGYIDPRAKSFYIQINEDDPILCNGDRDFRGKFNAHDPMLYKLKEHGTYTVKRLNNTRHSFPDKALVKYISV